MCYLLPKKGGGAQVLNRPAGIQFENDFFGCDIQRETGMPEWCPLYEALRRAKEIQWSRYKWSPSVPRTEIAMLVFNAVRQNLPALCRRFLQLYCSIDTALDWYFATDFFFSLKYPGARREGIVTADLTLLSEKDLDNRSDIYLSRIHLENKKKVETVGKFVASLLLERSGKK